jgi:uncharacterized Zn finger protein
MAPPPKFVPLRPRQELSKPALPAKPRKVRGGISLRGTELVGEAAWGAQRWMRLVEEAADANWLAEGLEYAKLGQTKKQTVSAGRVETVVQGRSVRPYVCVFGFDVLSPEQWEKVVNAMSENAMHAAKLMAGELPASVEDVFAPLGLKLYPTAHSDVRVSCECGHAMARRSDGTGGWCKHLACAAYLLANKLATEQFLMFQLRGIEASDLLDRLRQRRVVSGAAQGMATPLYQQRVPGVSDRNSPALEEQVQSFWSMPAAAREKLQELDVSLRGPEVSHPLLRRLGASPWTGPGSFPLVGLLASCYEVASQAAMSQAEINQATDNPEDDSSGEQGTIR